MRKVCTCGKIYNGYNSVTEPLGINELGFWFNCDRCKTTLLYEEISYIAPCDMAKDDTIVVENDAIVKILRQGLREVYNATTTVH